jgi:hypothetical protein
MTEALATIATAATGTAAIAGAVFALIVGIKVFKWAARAL